MDKSSLLEKQMNTLGQIGMRFHSALERAQAEGAPSGFVDDASHLMMQLGGGPDAGAIQAMRDADRDLVATQAFCDRWQSQKHESACAAVLEAAEQTLAALHEFRDTVHSLNPSGRADVEASARMGRAVLGKGCLIPILLLIIAFASVFTVIFYL